MTDFRDIQQNEYETLILAKRVLDVPLALRQDFDGDGRVLYLGEAPCGSLTSGAVWRVRKFTYADNGQFSAVTWADGNNKFDNVWDDRASLSYS